MKKYDWRYLGKITASILLSAVIGFFWISNYQKETKVIIPNKSGPYGRVFKDYLNDKTLVVFWASWCASCKEDLSSVKKFKDTAELPKNFSMISVNLDSKEDLPQAEYLWGNINLDIPLIYDEEEKIQSLLSIETLPTYFIFNKKGEALLRLEGKIDWMDKKIQSLIFN